MGGVDRKALRGEVIRSLRERLDQGQGGPRRPDREAVSTGCDVLDRWLPGKGLRRGTLVEWLAAEPAGGAGMLALFAAREAIDEGRGLVVIDRAGMFYPWLAERWGIGLEALLVVRPRGVQDEHWALDQVLRSAAAAAVLAWPERLDSRTFRRLQLAAEMGGVLGLLVRPDRARRERSWADVRWRVLARPTQAGWRLGVELLRSRGGLGAKRVELEIDETAGSLQQADPLRMAAPLARAADRRHQAGA